MKILPVVESINADIVATGVRIKKASFDGYTLANRTASIYKQNSAKRYLNITRSICDKLSKNITLNELPYFAAAVGMLTPFPLACPLFFCLGWLARYSIPKATALYNKVKTSNSGTGKVLKG